MEGDEEQAGKEAKKKEDMKEANQEVVKEKHVGEKRKRSYVIKKDMRKCKNNGESYLSISRVC